MEKLNNEKWQESRSVETKEIFNLLKDGQWHCRNCEINNPNFARRIQELKEMGYTIATFVNYHCPVCNNRRSTRLLLLPIDRIEIAGNGYETWSPGLRQRILRLFNYVDEKLYITPVACHGILRRGGNRINPRLKEVLTEISSRMSEEEIEEKSKRQPRGEESGMAKLTKKIKNAG